MSAKDEMSKDETNRANQILIDSYKSLVDQEIKARKNGDERHLKACLAGQQKVLRRINYLTGRSSSLKAETVTPKPAATKSESHQSSSIGQQGFYYMTGFAPLDLLSHQAICC